jgi:hypothetical protein
MLSIWSSGITNGGKIIILVHGLWCSSESEKPTRGERKLAMSRAPFEV